MYVDYRCRRIEVWSCQEKFLKADQTGGGHSGGNRVLPLDTPVDRAYAQLRWVFEQSGQVIGPNDMLITANLDEFSRIEGLRVETG